jgi:peptidoglycan hydrolase-like protein with peptidoglycan-binding domain
MGWRLAYALVTARSEVNALAPDRSKASDGTIGDPAHASRCSAHNPNNAGVVCAWDVTHDPDDFDAHAWADRLRRNPHPQLRYIISNGRIAGRATSWRWHVYTGSNKHTRHVHICVGGGNDCEPTSPYDSIAPWGIKSGVPVPRPGGDDEVQLRTLRKGNVGGDVKSLQLLLEGKAGQRVNHDGRFTDGVETGVKNVQRFFGLAVDGVCGPKTWGALFL